MKFRPKYPLDGRILLDGGKNNKFAPSLIADNESPDCLNVDFTNGAVGTREGMSKLNTTAVGSFVMDGLYTRRSQTGTETMFAFAGGSAWQLGGSTFTTVASGQSVWTAGVRVGSTNMENYLFMGNGNVIPYKVNATDFTRHGIYPPTTTMTAATAGTGAVLTGAYSYKMTWVNTAAVESDVGPVSNTLTAASENIRLTSLPVAPQSYGVSTRFLYRTLAGGTTYKRLATIADNTTTTYEDGIADGSLGATAPTDQGVPPKYSVIIYHNRRLFMNDLNEPNLVWYTELDNPYVVKTTNFFAVGDNSGDLVRGLGIHNNSLFIFCENSTHIEYMPSVDPTEWETIKAKIPYGCKSPHAIVNVGDGLMFPATEGGKLVGIAKIAGSTVVPSVTLLTISAAGSAMQSDRIETDVFDFVDSLSGTYSACVYKNKAYFTVTYGSGATENNRVYVYDFSISNVSRKQRAAWVPWSGWSASQFTVYSGNLYFGSSTANGRVYKAYAGVYSDDGSAINSYIWTKEFFGAKEHIDNHKDFRFLRFLADNAGSYFMNMAYRVDSDSGAGTNIPIDLNPDGSLWGTMMWGVDTWGGGANQEEFVQSLANARGKRIQYKFSNQNTVNQRFKVHSMRFDYNVKGDR